MRPIVGVVVVKISTNATNTINVENGAQVQIPGGEKQNVPEQGKPLVFTLIEIFGLNCIKTAVEKDAAH